MKLRVLLTLLAPLALLTACSGSDANNCNDGTDNDGDGLIDGADPGCAFSGSNESPDPNFPACADGVDNDEDGLIDTADPGCTDSDDQDEYNEPIAACQDGIDNDEDGLTDYPNDPGCNLTVSDSEKDDCPSGAGCPDCSNGVDDDDDGTLDYPADPGCNSAGDASEVNLDPNICGTSVLIQPLPADGIIMGSIANTLPNELISKSCGGSGEEHVYVYEPQTPVALHLTTNFAQTTLDTVVYLRGDCRDPETEYGCNDDDGLGVSTLNIDRLEPGTYYIVVDSASSTSSGDYRLEATAYTPAGETCVVDDSSCAPGLVCRLADAEATAETCQPPECSDGQNNDDDDLTDFPNDPGCIDANDNDESDSCPEGDDCPACSNGVDDDSDGLIDFANADPGCASAADDNETDDCVPGVPVRTLEGTGASGTTAGNSTFTPSCGFSTGPEHVYSFPLDRDLVSLSFSTIGSNYDTILSVRLNECGNSGAELGCEDPDGTGEILTIEEPAQGNYFVFVDGAFSSGDYVLNVTGVIGATGACTPGDAGYVCEEGFTCRVSTCVPAQCNDDVDDDGDSDGTGFPTDPGCDSISDDDEEDTCPAGVECPACGNGEDDDEDNRTDFPEDLGCQSAADDLELDECLPGIGLLQLTDDGVTSATPTVAVGSNFTPSCYFSTSSTEDVYAYRNTRDLDAIIFSTLGSNGDSVVSVRQNECGDPEAEVACANTTTAGEEIRISNPGVGETYYVFVDGAGVSGIGYVLNVGGTIPLDQACDAADTQFICDPEAGYTCVSGTCQPSQCADGVSNGDADGLIDLADPGCENAEDNTEDPNPATAPQCFDDVDNDSDGLIDYPEDVGCSMASDDTEQSCLDSDPVVNIVAPITTGTTSGATHDWTPTCSGSSVATDVAHQIIFPGALQSLSVNTTGSAFDTVAYLKAGDCSVAEDVACNDDGPSVGPSAFVTDALPSGLYYIIVDGYSSSAGGYTLNVSGIIAAGEACDADQVTSGIVSCSGAETCQSGTCQ